MAEATDLHIHITGAGTAGLPIVLSHGVGSDTTVWDALAADLSGAHLVAAWDQPGSNLIRSFSQPDKQIGFPVHRNLNTNLYQGIYTLKKI